MNSIRMQFAGPLVASAALVLLMSAAANAQPTPSPAPSAAVADPCGDTDLLATTDRPTFGTNPCVVKYKDTVVELGYRNTTTSDAPNSARSSTYPQPRTRIGIAPNLEVVLDFPSAQHFASNGTLVSGESNIGTGLKYELGYGSRWVHGIAAEAVYPTGSTGFTTGLPSYNGSYQAGYAILPGLGVGGTLGFNTFSSPNPAGGKNVGTTAFTPAFQVGGVIASQTKLTVELAHSTSAGPRTSGQSFADAFLQHAFGRNFLVDINGGTRFNVVNGTHQHYVGAGGSIKL